MSMLRQTIISDMADISITDWNSFVKPEDPLWQYELFQFVTRSELGPDGFRFIIFYYEDRIAAIIPLFWFNALQLIENASAPWQAKIQMLRRAFPRLAEMPTLFCGNLIGEGHFLIASWAKDLQLAEQIFTSVYQFAREHKLRWIVFKDLNAESIRVLDSHITDSSYFSVDALPDTLLNIRDKTFDNYIDQLKKKPRQKAKKFLRDFHSNPEFHVKMLDWPNYNDNVLLPRIIELYEQVFAKAEMKLEHLTATFFKDLSCHIPRSKVLTLWHKDKLIAFGLGFLTEDRFVLARMGMDYEFAHEHHLYFVLHYEAIRFAINANCKEVNFCQSSYHAKLEIGCHLVPLTHVMTHTNVLIRTMMKGLIPRVLGDYNHADLVRANLKDTNNVDIPDAS